MRYNQRLIRVGVPVALIWLSLLFYHQHLVTRVRAEHVWSPGFLPVSALVAVIPLLAIAIIFGSSHAQQWPVWMLLAWDVSVLACRKGLDAAAHLTVSAGPEFARGLLWSLLLARTIVLPAVMAAVLWRWLSARPVRDWDGGVLAGFAGSILFLWYILITALRPTDEDYSGGMYRVLMVLLEDVSSILILGSVLLVGMLWLTSRMRRFRR